VVNIGLFPSNQAPVLHLNASATSVAVREVASFAAVAHDADGDLVAYSWDFGDGTFGTNSPTASTSWSSPGEYAVRCVVTDMKGGVASQSKIVSVGAPSTYRISGL